MDAIRIKDLAVRWRVGVSAAERRRPQRLLLTLELAHDLSAAARTDQLSATIDYSTVCRRLVGLGKGRSWRLIETVAADVASLLISEFGAAAVTVEVKKFPIPSRSAKYVSVRLTRPVPVPPR